jgi:L-aspartate oxidase
MTARMNEQHVDHLWLDATGLAGFDERFPTIAEALRQLQLDPAGDWLPIAPAAHYLCGGIVTDIDGATALPSLWAAGEVANAGVHGANRLASNSLLDGMVFGSRVVEAVERGKREPEATGAMRAVLLERVPPPVIGGRAVRQSAVDPSGEVPFGEAAQQPDLPKLREQLQRAMTTGAGVLRGERSLRKTSEQVLACQRALPTEPPTQEVAELRNLADVAQGLLTVALAREESRGSHTRTDFPLASEDFRVRLVLS